MTLFQVSALTVVAVMCLATLAAFFRSGFVRRDALAWSFVWIAAGVAIAWPQLTASAARRLGIGRGADLVLYCAVVVMMVGFLMVYSRLRQVRRDLTLVVRHLALLEADAASDTSSSAPAVGNGVRAKARRSPGRVFMVRVLIPSSHPPRTDSTRLGRCRAG